MRIGYLLGIVAFLAVPAAAQDGPTAFAIGGVDLNEGGFYTYVGAGARIDGDIDSSGPMVRALAGYGEFDQTAAADGDVTAVNVMLGYQWVSPDTRVSIYGGVDYQDHTLPGNPLNPVAGEAWGAKVQAEVYSQPGAGTMLLGVGSYSTANDSYLFLAKAGVGISQTLFLGPEAGVLGNERYDQWRVGAHLTGFRVGPVGLSASLGYLGSDPGENGIYGTVGFTARF